MKETSNIPQPVLDAAKTLIEIYGAHFNYLGKYEGQDAYIYQFPQDSSTGYPFVYLWDGKQATEVSGVFSLNIIDLLVKDASK